MQISPSRFFRWLASLGWEGKRLMLVTSAVAIPVVVVGSMSTLLLYNAALEGQRERLVETANSQARLIEAMARFQSANTSGPADGEAATLRQIVDAHGRYKGFGETGEFTLARRVGENIVFVASHRHFDLDKPHPVPFEGRLAEPMRQALLGRSGTLIGLDYRGEMVLAAVEPVAGLKMGLVAKIDLAEIRAPFLRVGLITLAMGLGAILGGMALFIRVFDFFHRSLRESEARGNAILDATDNGMVIFDRKGGIVSFNRAAKKLFALETAGEMAISLQTLLPPHLPENQAFFSAWPPSEEMALHGSPWELKAHRGDGSQFSAEFSFRQLGTRGGNRLIGTFWDITERKKSDALKEEFISTLSHELRTPLTSIMGSIGIIMGMYKSKLEPEVADMLALSQRNSDHLVRLVSDLLDIQRLEAGKLDMHFKPVDLASLLDYSVSVNKGFADKFEVSVHAVPAPPATMVLGDWDRLNQVMTNLLSNAIKFSPKQAQVDILAECMEDRVRVKVIDRGGGVPEQFRDRIFQKFSQAVGTGERGKRGSGLGLSISKAIVESHGGTIGFHSRENEGTEFYFDLPLAPEAGPVPAKQEIRPAPLRDPTRSSR